MEIDAEQKKRFFELAIAKEYLPEEIIAKWEFLPLKEFLHNGYIEKEHYRELFQEITGQALSDEDGDDKANLPLPLSARPMRKKFSGLTMPIYSEQAVSDSEQLLEEKREDITENVEPVLQTKEQVSRENIEKPLLAKISLKELKQRSKKTKEAIKAARISNQKRQMSEQEEIVELEDCAPDIDDTHYDPEKEAWQRHKANQRLNEKLHRRTVRELLQSLFYSITVSGAALFMVNIFFICGPAHAFLCLALGAGAGYLLHSMKGNGGIFMFSAAYVLCLASGEALGAGIISAIFGSYGGAIVFLILAGGCMLYICLGRAIGEAIASVRLNNC